MDFFSEIFTNVSEKLFYTRKSKSDAKNIVGDIGRRHMVENKPLYPIFCCRQNIATFGQFIPSKEKTILTSLNTLHSTNWLTTMWNIILHD